MLSKNSRKGVLFYWFLYIARLLMFSFKRYDLSLMMSKIRRRIPDGLELISHRGVFRFTESEPNQREVKGDFETLPPW